MIPPLSAWPTWYVLLIAYTAICGLLALRDQRAIAAALKAQERITTDPRQRGEIWGRRVASWTRPIWWFLATALLLTGRSWAIMIVAVVYALSARRIYGEYAQGFAEGYKAAELASAPEYVRGRVVPSTRDRAVALVYVSVTRIVPLGATLVALTRIGR